MNSNIIQRQIAAYQSTANDAAGLDGGGHTRTKRRRSGLGGPTREAADSADLGFGRRGRRRSGAMSPKGSRGEALTKPKMSESALQEARAQALRGRWRMPKSCTSLLSGKQSLFSPASPFMRRWDLLMAILLLFTAIVTPFEVAFLETEVNFLFVVNRIVDILFAVDMAVNFLAPYQGKGKEEGQWIYDGGKIARNYLVSWFTIDLLSLLPFDLMSVVFTSPEIQKLKVVRIVRLFRLLKLFRVFRAKRIMARWETLIDFNYKLVSLVKFATLMVAFAHWMSCVWMLAANVASSCTNICHEEDDDLIPEMTWVDGAGLVGGAAFDLYAAALYWSVMTLSTIGYGDITPANATETLIGIFCMLCGASLWAYVVGNVCGVVASLDVRTLAFRQTMDDLNFFMAEKSLPNELRARLREYFHQARHMHQTGNYEGLLRKLSPKLRGEVALATNRDWVSKVHYFKFIRDECLSAIAVSLRASVYAPSEVITGYELHIVMRGVAGQQGRIITRGNVWGEDMILEARHLRRVTPVRALTYLDVYALSRRTLFEILEDYPVTRKRIQRAALLMALVRTAAKIRELRKKEAGRDATEAESKINFDAAENEVRGLAVLSDPSAEETKEMLHTTTAGSLDITRVQSRLVHQTEVMVKEQIQKMEKRFAEMAQRMEQRLLVALGGGDSKATPLGPGLFRTHGSSRSLTGSRHRPRARSGSGGSPPPHSAGTSAPDALAGPDTGAGRSRPAA